MARDRRNRASRPACPVAEAAASRGRPHTRPVDQRRQPDSPQAYDYDINGDRIKDERGTHTFNARSQQTSWTGSAKKVWYTVDGLGQITKQVDDPVAAGEATTTTSTTFAGDRAVTQTVSAGTSTSFNFCYTGFGNLERIQQSACTASGASADVEYGYDAFDRETSAKTTGQPKVTYEYDGLDRRDSKCTYQSATATDCTGGRKAEMSYVGMTNTLADEHETNNDNGANPKDRTYDYDANLDRLGFAQTTSTGTDFRSYQTDANGSVTGLEEDGGNAPTNERYSYDPYGNDQSTGPTNDTLANDNPFRFEGSYYDSGVKTYDMHARNYRPEIGRFLTEDRYEAAQGDLTLQSDALTQSRYAFAGGNPVNMVEWDGHGAPLCDSCGARGPQAGPGKYGNTHARRKNRGVHPHAVDQANARDETALQWQKVGEKTASRTGSSAKQVAPPKPHGPGGRLHPPGQNVSYGGPGLDTLVANAITGTINDLSPDCDLQYKYNPNGTLPSLECKHAVRALVTAASLVAGDGAGRGALWVGERVAGRLIGRTSVEAGGDAVTGGAAGRLRAPKGTSGTGATTGLRDACLPGNSFTADTPVLMADGTEKPISQVKVGDKVVATDPETGRTETRPVTH